MSSVEVFSRARMQEIEDEAIVDARIDSVGAERRLILIKHNGEEINAGDVRGPAGTPGTTPTVPDEINWFVNPGVPIAGTEPIGSGNAQPLKMQAGSAVITTNTVGRAAITFPTPFAGIASVIAQIGDVTDPTYTHLNGVYMGDGVFANTGVFNVQVEGYVLSGFHITLTIPSVEPGPFGTIADPSCVAVGGCSPIRINWMAFGW